MSEIIIDCISDLHGHKPKLEGGDLLIVGGDLTARDCAHEYLKFGEWIAKQKYKKKIVIGGNHDNLIAGGRWKLCTPESYGWDFDYLEDSGTEFYYFEGRFPEEDEGFLPSGNRTLKIWGTPWTLRFAGQNPECMAFTVDMEIQLQEKWEMIPDDTDILVTHSPAYGMLDMVNEGCGARRCGSTSLMSNLRRITPKLHVFGHIHSGYGIRRAVDEDGIPGYPISVNASIMDETHRPVNAPIRVVL